jgi:hypothetical protein
MTQIDFIHFLFRHQKQLIDQYLKNVDISVLKSVRKHCFDFFMKVASSLHKNIEAVKHLIYVFSYKVSIWN